MCDVGIVRWTHDPAGAQPTNGRKAFWRMTYVDDTLRLLYTNKGNLFILTKTE